MIKALIGSFLERYKIAAIAIAVGLVIALFVGVYWKGRLDEAAQVREKAATAQALQDVKKAVADGKADTTRLTDTQAAQQHEEGLKHADDDQPDAAPSRARLAQSCERLRQQGSDLAKVPACAGLGGGGKTPARR